jgi:prenyltransferase beta subunit
MNTADFLPSGMMLLTFSCQMLDQKKTKLVSTQAIRRFLFEKTQHRIGGFGKCPGNVPGELSSS